MINEKRETANLDKKSVRSSLIWQKAKHLALSAYRYTQQFPQSEQYGLVSQMRRAAISVSSNIAEGYNRLQKREKRQFLVIARGSVGELESQLDIAQELFPDITAKEVADIADEVSRMLNSIITTRF